MTVEGMPHQRPAAGIGSGGKRSDQVAEREARPVALAGAFCGAAGRNLSKRGVSMETELMKTFAYTALALALAAAGGTAQAQVAGGAGAGAQGQGAVNGVGNTADSVADRVTSTSPTIALAVAYFG